MLQIEDILLSLTFCNKSVGCSEEEILFLEKRLQLKLPRDYRAFLSKAGKGMANLWVGSDYRYDDLLDMQQAAQELLQDVGIEMPEGSFVFYMHQGYVFFFFAYDAVFYFMEEDKKFIKRYDSFTDFFMAAPKPLIKRH